MIRALPDGRGFRVNLAALPNAPLLARRFLTTLLAAWRIDETTASDALLCISELTTNAARTTGRVDGPTQPLPDETVRTIIVRASLADDGVRVEVWDNSPAAPAVVEADAFAENGRGLLLVASLADEWGCDPEAVTPGGVTGKNVWFRLKAVASAPPREADSTCQDAPQPAAAEPDSPPVPTVVAPLRPAIPPDRPAEPACLPRRTRAETPARALVDDSGQGWWVQTRPPLAAMAATHAALVNSLENRPLQPTGEQQCVNA